MDEAPTGQPSCKVRRLEIDSFLEDVLVYEITPHSSDEESDPDATHEVKRKELRELPELRNPPLRIGWTENLTSFNRLQYTGRYIQNKGSVNVHDCRRCAFGLGPWEDCVSLRLPSGMTLNDNVCGNCTWDGNERECNLS
jgi:hypothetical protein